VDELTKPGQAGAEIEVTPAMVAAGLDEFREHHFGGDIGYMLESIYRAMCYAARAAASETSVSR
jgi:hypothetical protein